MTDKLMEILSTLIEGFIVSVIAAVIVYFLASVLHVLIPLYFNGLLLLIDKLIKKNFLGKILILSLVITISIVFALFLPLVLDYSGSLFVQLKAYSSFLLNSLEGTLYYFYYCFVFWGCIINIAWNRRNDKMKNKT